MATRMPISSSIGMVSAATPGRSVPISCSNVAHGTPFAIICSANSMMKGIIRMNVNTSKAIKNGGMISRITYRSRIRIRMWLSAPVGRAICTHYCPW